jgi:hypothetical protein
MSSRAAGAVVPAASAGGGDHPDASAPSGSGERVETLAEAIERVWARRGAWPARSEQQQQARDRANWASVWVLATEVAQPDQTRGTGEFSATPSSYPKKARLDLRARCRRRCSTKRTRGSGAPRGAG